MIPYLAIALLAVGVVTGDDGNPRGPHSKPETERDGLALLEHTTREIDRIAAEFHAKLSRKRADSIGVIYCRYSTRHQDSVADQVRSILEEAVRLDIFVPREYIFFDLAVRGYKSRRVGLDQLRQVLERKAVSVAMFFATNRLFRKIHRTLAFVEESIVEQGIRAIFIKSGVDTADTDRWRMLLTFHSMMDEFGVSMYADNIRAAHEGLLEKRLVFGTISYGYTGEPISGETTRRGRPRCRLTIDPVTSTWVARIFVWYVVDHLPIAAIIHRLNDDSSIPLPLHCTSGTWTRLAVRNILTNTRYRGFWQYGVKETIWISSKDYSRQVARKKPLKENQIDELRIVSDALWYEAQHRLAQRECNGGRYPLDGDRKSRPKVLNGILWCPEHDRPLYVGGPHGQSMFCPACYRLKPEKRSLFTHLNRALALQLTCEKLAELIRTDDDLVCRIVNVCQREAEAFQRPDTGRIEQLTTQAEQLSHRIRFAMSHVGETEEDQRETTAVLSELRQRRAELQAEISSLKAARHRRIEIPTEKQVTSMLDGFARILTAAAHGDLADDGSRARAILMQLTGGRINLYQCGERRAQRGWLQGRFTVPFLAVVVKNLTGETVNTKDDGIEVTVDYRRPVSCDADAERAKELYDKGLLGKQIALELGCCPSKVVKLLNYAFAKRGEKRPDGNKRRTTLLQKQMATPRYQQIADAAKEFWDEGLAVLEIARRLHCSDATAWKAVAHWHRFRKLPVPTAKTRREQIINRAKELYDDNLAIKDIATELGYTARGIKLLLQRWFQSHGQEMPDGRTRRHNRGKAT